MSRSTSREVAARILPAALAIAVIVGATSAIGQQLTPDPAAWRPLSYVDLRSSTSSTRTFHDIWRDEIEANNRLYESRGDTRFRGSNAPATEAHFVVWSARKSAVLTILNTATGCTLKEARTGTGATVRFCPVRLAVYEGATVQTLEGGRACFLELAASTKPADPARAAAYGSYDKATKVVRLGLVIDHQPVEGCSLSFPLYPQ